MTAPAIPTVDVAGVSIPKLGIGTWPMRGETCSGIVTEAIRTGFRLIDTAQGYGNEADVGIGIRQAGVPRDALFLVTKVHPERLGRDAMMASVEASLEKLGTDRVDLLLIHWPNPATPLEEMIGALNDVHNAGLTRAIGVSNFTSKLLAKACKLSDVPLAAEQIEYHPFLDQSVMRKAIHDRGMALMAYCPIALGRVVSDPVIGEIAAAHGKTAVQVTLRWLIQQEGVVAIPKTSKPERLAENFAIFDFELSDEEMKRMGDLKRSGARLIDEPKWVPEWD